MAWSSTVKMEDIFRCRVEMVLSPMAQANPVLDLFLDPSVKHKTASGELLIISDRWEWYIDGVVVAFGKLVRSKLQSGMGRSQKGVLTMIDGKVL